MGRKKKKKNKNKATAKKESQPKASAEEKAPAMSAFDALDTMELAEKEEREPPDPKILTEEEVTKEKVMNLLEDFTELAEVYVELGQNKKMRAVEQPLRPDLITDGRGQVWPLITVTLGIVALGAGLGISCAAFDFGEMLWKDFDDKKQLVFAFFILAALGLIAGLFGLKMIFEGAKSTRFSMGWRVGVVLAVSIGMTIAAAGYQKGLERGRVPISMVVIGLIHIVRTLQERKAEREIEGDAEDAKAAA